MVRVEYGRRCTRIDANRSADGDITGWLVHLADGSTIGTSTLVIGAGREPNVPEAFTALPRERVIHSTEYAMRADDLDPDEPLRVAVVGSAQSAAEMLWDAHQRLPRAQCTMVMRAVGLEYYQTSRFTNELYFPSFTDEFYGAPPEARRQVLREMRQTNYAGVAPEMLDTLFRQIYLERLTGTQRLRMTTMADIVGAKMDDGEVVLTLADRMGRMTEELRCDVVLLGTGFNPGMPTMVRQVAALAGADDVAVTRAYRMILPPSVTAACYLQGTNEDSHGIADSLISVIAVRSGEIVGDMLAQRTDPDLLASVATPA
jgi:L-ornithine N5-oxygenase